MRVALIFIAACSDPAAAPDAPPIDAPAACTAELTGNVVEHVSTTNACATDSIHLELPSSFPLALDFAVTATGDYTSESSLTWSAMGTRILGHDSCLFAAGDQVVPHGTFVLHVASLAPPHGTLSLDQPVHATEFTDCGTPLLEHVEVVF